MRGPDLSFNFLIYSHRVFSLPPPLPPPPLSARSPRSPAQEFDQRGVRYTGVDTVRPVISVLQKEFSNDDTKRFFVRDLVSDAMPQGAELIISRQVLQHMEVTDVLATLHSWSRSGAKYLLMSSFGLKNTGISHYGLNFLPLERQGAMVTYDFEARPFALEAPLERYLEHPGCQLAKPGLSDKRCSMTDMEEKRRCKMKYCTQNYQPEALMLWPLPLRPAQDCTDERDTGYFDFGFWRKCDWEAPPGKFIRAAPSPAHEGPGTASVIRRIAYQCAIP